MPSVILLNICTKRISEDYCAYIVREINDVYTDGHQHMQFNCCYIVMCYLVVIRGLGD